MQMCPSPFLLGGGDSSFGVSLRDSSDTKHCLSDLELYSCIEFYKFFLISFVCNIQLTLYKSVFI